MRNTSVRINTKYKYLKFMQDCFEQKEFKGTEKVREHKVSSRILLVLKERKIINRAGHLSIWIGDAPTLGLANGVAFECLQMMRMNKYDKEIIRANKTAQLQTKPIINMPKQIKKVQSVQVEEQHTPYPIMDIVIAFLAGMIAAGFISIIWK